MALPGAHCQPADCDARPRRVPLGIRQRARHGTSMAHPPPSAGVRRRPRTRADQPQRSADVRRRPAVPDFQAGYASSILVTRSQAFGLVSGGRAALHKVPRAISERLSCPPRALSGTAHDVSSSVTARPLRHRRSDADVREPAARADSADLARGEGAPLNPTPGLVGIGHRPTRYARMDR